jgi:hypothetical protein
VRAKCDDVISTTLLSPRGLHGLATRLVRTRQRSAWACLIAVTLVFKSFVPLLAATSAQMQGKSVAEICSVYGVALPSMQAHVQDVHVHDASAHAMHHMAGMEMAAAGGTAPADHHPADHAAHAQDHCALTGLAACAVFSSTTLWAVAEWSDADRALVAVDDAVEPLRDASARWLTLRLHAPPRLS